MRVAISQSNYIPWKGYFDMINSVDHFVLYDDMQYTKRDWRNRNKIKTPQGSQWLTVGVEVKGKYSQKINETKIIDQSWKNKHWKSIAQNYKKAKYFENYYEIFEKLYTEIEEELLSNVNYAFIKTINEILGINTVITWSSEYDLAEDRNERLLNICVDLGADEYVSGPAAKGYMDTEIFTQKGIDVTWMDYTGYPEYDQLYPPFEHAVTVLDLIFNEGPNAHKYMKSFGV